MESAFQSVYIGIFEHEIWMRLLVSNIFNVYFRILEYFELRLIFVKLKAIAKMYRISFVDTLKLIVSSVIWLNLNTVMW